MVVLNGPLCERRGVANGRLAQRWHRERKAPEIPWACGRDMRESGQSESDAQWASAEATAYCVKHSEKARELRRRAGADRARKQLVFEPRISARAENARYKFPGPLVRGRHSRRGRIG